MNKTLTGILLVLAAVAAVVGALMWWKTKKKPETATHEVKDMTTATSPNAGAVSVNDFDPSSPSAKYGQLTAGIIDYVIN